VKGSFATSRSHPLVATPPDFIRLLSFAGVAVVEFDLGERPRHTGFSPARIFVSASVYIAPHFKRITIQAGFGNVEKRNAVALR
jgi:hypothetical protein